MIPSDRRYTKEHEWIKLHGQSAFIGITDHAQGELGDIVFVELPEVGDKFELGESVAVVESVKAVSNIYTQVAGTVSQVNEALADNPEKLNEAAYDEHIFVLEVTTGELGETLSAEEYALFLEDER